MTGVSNKAPSTGTGYIPSLVVVNALRCCDLLVSSCPARGRWHRQAEQRIQPASSSLLVHIENALREENQSEQFVALARHHAELCLVCREWVSHFTSSAFPWASPCVWDIWKATPAHRTVFCQNSFELKHWSPSLFCYAAPAWQFLTHLPRRHRGSGGGRCFGGQGEQSCPTKAGATPQQQDQACRPSRSRAAALLENLGRSASAHVWGITDRSTQGLFLVLLPFFKLARWQPSSSANLQSWIEEPAEISQPENHIGSFRHLLLATAGTGSALELVRGGFDYSKYLWDNSKLHQEVPGPRSPQVQQRGKDNYLFLSADLNVPFILFSRRKKKKKNLLNYSIFIYYYFYCPSFMSECTHTWHLAVYPAIPSLTLIQLLPCECCYQ